MQSGSGFSTVTTISDTMKYGYNRHKTEQYFKVTYDDYKYLTPDFDVLLPVISVHYLGRLNKEIYEETLYKRQDLFEGGISKLFFLPIRSSSYTKFISSIDTCFQFSFDPSIYYNYTFTTITNTPIPPPYNVQSNFNLHFFTKVAKQTQTIKNIRNEVLKIYETEFTYFPLDTITQSKVVSKWDKALSYYQTAKARFIQGNNVTISSYYDVTYTKWQLPPLYGLTTREVVKDPSNNILTGKGYRYNLDFDPNNIQARRGALLADSLIGKNGTNVKLLTNYGYRGGSDMNFLTTVENSIGAKSKTYYSYSDIADLSGAYPVGKKLYNTDEIDNVTLFEEKKEFESPVANETYVRKIDASGVPYTETLRTYFEKTTYGQNAAMIDPNNWYYKNKYDDNGRLLFSWHPFDFPKCNETVITTNQAKVYFLDMKTRVSTQVDEINYDTEEIISTTFGTDYFIDNKLIVGREIEATLPFGMNFPNDTIEQKSYTYTTLLEYHASNYDALKFHTIDSAFLQLDYQGMNQSDGMVISIKTLPNTNNINFNKRLVLDSKGLQLLKDTLVYSQPNGFPYIKINLNEILSSLRNITHSDSLVFEITSKSLYGKIQLVDFSEDKRPQIVVYYTGCSDVYDFTVKNKYDDDARTILTTSKIDDNLHTSNTGWTRTFAEHKGRYTEAKSYYGIGSRIHKQELTIGSPSSPIRTDSIVYTLNGQSQLRKVKDQLGNIATSEFINGNLVYMKNSDNTDKSFSNLITDGDLDLNYTGFTSKSFSIDENDRNVESVYDMFGNLRKKKVYKDNQTLFLKYNYDLLGNLIEVIHPNNSITRYVYDDFNRLKLKINPDLDTIAYSYNDLGQVRFTQNKEQRINNKFSFTQYDDLGRVTISGEATVDPEISDHRTIQEWLIDELEPNQLNYDNFESLPVTINPTLWLLPDRPTPKFWTRDSLTEFWPTLFDYVDDVSNISSNQTYLKHPANYYWSYNNWQNTVLSDIDNFEDVKEFPEFVKVVNHYDELPERTGAVWGNFPTTDEWNFLLVNNPWETGYPALRNLKGRTAAVAYRDNGKEPFHYIVYSYDPRGRVQAMLKYNENLGFEAVYYKYNSANKVIQQRVFDASRQFSTWYSYDDNGRVDSVWTSKVEDGFDVYYPYNIPSCPTKPEQAD
ncbi:MAG TPA: RHS repeat protein, partial [Candidatus Kapabacteria bacterium]|nr:RHS repeat protein [Candidatus Kapabacteria bacterium]